MAGESTMTRRVKLRLAKRAVQINDLELGYVPLGIGAVTGVTHARFAVAAGVATVVGAVDAAILGADASQGAHKVTRGDLVFRALEDIVAGLLGWLATRNIGR